MWAAAGGVGTAGGRPGRQLRGQEYSGRGRPGRQLGGIGTTAGASRTAAGGRGGTTAGMTRTAAGLVQPQRGRLGGGGWQLGG
jgi:ATP-dependent RNA helicase RhlE